MDELFRKVGLDIFFNRESESIDSAVQHLQHVIRDLRAYQALSASERSALAQLCMNIADDYSLMQYMKSRNGTKPL